MRRCAWTLAIMGWLWTVVNCLRYVAVMETATTAKGGPAPADRTRAGRTRIVRGPTGKRVAVNLRAIRERRGFTVRALSARLTDAGRPILPSGITKAETGDRAVDVDDLTAFAAVLGCSPNALLLDPAADDRAVALTPRRTLRARDAWGWARGVTPVSADGNVGLYVTGDQDGRGVRRLWSVENRPDDPEADPADMLEAVDQHRGLMDALVDADAALAAAGVSEAVRQSWIDRQRDMRVLARRGPRGKGGKA